MCKLTTSVFHHVCTHTLTITTPSLNPNCAEEIFESEYLDNARCPKCNFWSGSKYSWDDWGSGIVCDGYSGQTTRNFRVEMDNDEKTFSKIELWERRKEGLRKVNEWKMKEQQRVFEGARALEEETGVDKKRRTYFLKNDGGIDGGFFTEVGELGNGILDVRCWCEANTELLEEKRLRQDGQHQLISLPCGDIFHAICIKKHLSSSDICPVCQNAFSITREQSPHLPVAFQQEMMRDLFDVSEEDGKMSFGDWLVDIAALIALVVFMYKMPLWICWSVVFVGFVMATWDEMRSGDRGSLRLEEHGWSDRLVPKTDDERYFDV